MDQKTSVNKYRLHHSVLNAPGQEIAQPNLPQYHKLTLAMPVKPTVLA